MIVFVHGVPETSAIWRKISAAVDRDAVALYLSHGFRHWEEADAALPLETRPRYLYFLKTLAS